jgi:hypothetical protein
MSATTEEVQVSVLASYTIDGYVKEDGARDIPKIAERVAAILSEDPVRSWTEAKTKPVTRADMVERVFPSLPGPEAWADQEDPDLAEKTWNRVNNDLWGISSNSPRSPLQRYVATLNGSGYFVCRRKVGKHDLLATYISDDARCIMADCVSPAETRAARAATQYTDVLVMVVTRKPEMAKTAMRSYSARMKQLTQTGHDQLMLAIERATEETVESAEAESE